MAKKLLIVEDSPTMRKLYKAVLGREPDTELLFAMNGVEGLDCAAREPDIDLFIVDINMPEMDGISFIRQLREDLGVRDVPAIVISTEGSEEDRAAAMAAGGTAYLQKPWTPEELSKAVHALYS